MTYLTRYRPWSDVLSFPREMDRWMDDAFNTRNWFRLADRQWFPVADVSETSDHLTLRLEVPGMSAENIKIGVENNTLTVRGEKRHETKSEDETVYRAERSYGAFERSFSLPWHVDHEDVSAKLENGVLTIRLPRREEAKPREIAIEGDSSAKKIEG
ncbi:MAG: Hsp20/alpha crystallin family protein [Gemmatimonadetes bacterium]|nr:Hsp20/alpha crystallin family protein [Gemmatimonadota bacterium]